jgi:hypothetical protein
MSQDQQRNQQYQPYQEQGGQPPYPPQYGQQPPGGYYQPGPGQQPYSPPPGYEVRKRKSWPRRHWFLTFVFFPFVLLIVIIIIAVAASSGGSGTSTGTGGGGGTVTYIVTGTGSADVTYGPDGSSYTGKVPMKVSAKIPSSGAPDYYAVSAQLNGSGSVTCEIEVGGKVISKGTASGQANIADCEIVPGFAGGWQDTNS